MWSEKTKQREKVTWTKLGVVFVERLFNFFAITLVLSFLIHYNYKFHTCTHPNPNPNPNLNNLTLIP